MTVTGRGVYITGTGVVSCAGNSSDTLWESAFSGRSGIREGVGRVSLESLPPYPLLFDKESELSSGLRFSLEASRQAFEKAGWESLRSDDGLILATTTGQIPLWEKALVEFLHKDVPEEKFSAVFADQPIGVLLDAISDELKFGGRSFLVSSACASATQAIGLGADWIRSGRVKRCLVIGVEVLSQLTLEGFKSLQLLSPFQARPFDRERKGINLSEGAGALCLEAEPKGPRLALISGFGMGTDGHHMTAPEPEGAGCQQAIREALKSAAIAPSEISWVHAHGTGSAHNDLAEGTAIAKCLEASVAQGKQPPVTSTKNIHGHSLGACGAIEVVLCVEAIRRQMILKTAGLENPDPQIPVRHANVSGPGSVRHVLKTTLGFGGANAALILSRVSEEV